MDTGGLKTAVAEAMATAEPDDAPEQLALLPLADAERVADAGGVLPAERRGPGRRPGSRNRSTEAWRTLILGRYRSPLEVLAETWSRPVEALSAELGCTRLEAFRVQQAAAEAALPYLHSKAPTELAVSGQGLVPLVIQVGGDAAIGGGFAALTNQWVSGSAEGQSERSQSERCHETEAGAGDGDA